MEAATYLLFAIGILGASDILFFHTLSHRIRSNPDSRLELQIHSLRGPTYGLLFILIPNCVFHGGCYWMLIGLFAADVSISIWDFSVEKASRRSLGGLPTGEYVLHVILAMLFGAMVACLLTNTWDWASLPARFAYEPANVPALLRAGMAIMSVMVLTSGIQDALAAYRLKKSS